MATKTETTTPVPPPNQMRFSGIIGHEEIIHYLRQAHQLGRLPQTLLFDGPRGVGKSAMAFALAKFLLAGGREEGEAFERHSRKVEADPPIHPDLRMLVPSGPGGQIRVDDVRDVIDVSLQMPLEAERRIIIIDPLDRLNVSSANTLLKLLEEPPPLLTLILATDSIHAILPTIRSRAARLRLHPLGDEAIAKWLVEAHGAEPKIARVAALYGEGCPGRALDQLGGKALADRDTLINEWQFFQKHGMQGLFRVAFNLADISQPLETVLSAWMTWLRDGLVCATSPGREDLLVNADRATDLAEEASRIDPRALGRCLELIAEARPDARRMINKQLFFETLLLRLGPELKRS